MILRSLMLSAVFMLFGYTVRIHRERFQRRTIKVYIHLQHHGIEPVTVGVDNKAYEVLCENDRCYTHLCDAALNTMKEANHF